MTAEDGGGGTNEDALLVDVVVVVTNMLCLDRFDGGPMLLSPTDVIDGVVIFVDAIAALERTAAERFAPTVVRVLRVDSNDVEVILVPSTVPVVANGNVRNDAIDVAS